jgi:uncharacterized membrane protein YphA (DoxX/SURF4 family)
MTASEESKNPRRKLGRVLLVLGRIALAAVFLYSGYVKLKPPAGMAWSIQSVRISLSMFAFEVEPYQLLPPWAVTFVAHTLPPFELFLGLWLLSGLALRYSSMVTTLLLAGFFSVVVRTYIRGIEIPCGCFGSDEPLGPATIVRDGLFLVLSLGVTLGAFWDCRKRAKSSMSAAPPVLPQSAE